MSELKFSSEKEAVQHLADITGKSVRIAAHPDYFEMTEEEQMKDAKLSIKEYIGNLECSISFLQEVLDKTPILDKETLKRLIYHAGVTKDSDIKSFETALRNAIQGMELRGK